MTVSEIEEVFEALDNAIENGYEHLLTDELESVATDIQSFCSHCEDIEHERLIEMVAQWRKTK